MYYNGLISEVYKELKQLKTSPPKKIKTKKEKEKQQQQKNPKKQ